MALKINTLAFFLYFSIVFAFSQTEPSPFVDGERFFSRRSLDAHLKQTSIQLKRELKYDYPSTEFLYNKSGEVYTKLGNIEKSLFYLKMAHDLASVTDDQEGIAVTCISIANLYQQQGKYREAVPLCKKAIIIQQQMTFDDYLAFSYYTLGVVYHSLGQYEPAIQECIKAKNIQEQLETELSLSRTYNIIGTIYNDLAQYEKALYWCNKSHAIRKQLGAKNELAISINTIGYIYFSQGNYKESLLWYFKAQAIQEKNGFKADLAHTYNNIGAAYKYQGLFDKALAWCQKGRIIVEQLGQKVKMAKAYNNIGIIYNAKEDYAEALTWYKKAQKIREDLGLEVDLAISYNNIAGIYEHLGQYDKAESFCKKAIAIQEKLGLDIDLAISCNMMGYIYNTQEKYELAILWYSRTKNIREKLQLETGLPHAYNNLATVYQSVGLFRESLSYINKAKRIQERLNLDVNLAITYNNFAHIYYKFNKLDSALYYAQLSISLHEQLRNLNRGQTDRQIYLDKSQPALGFGLASAYKLAQYPTAFSLSEKAKARGLADLLVEKAIQLKKLPEEIDTSYQLVINQLNAINQMLADDIPEAKRTNLLTSRNKLYKEKKVLEDQIKTIAPAYANLAYPETTTHNQTQSVLKNNEALVSFFTGTENTYVFIITPTAFQMLDLGTTDSLKMLVNQYRHDFLPNQRNAAQRGDMMQNNQLKLQFFSLSSQLYQKLWTSVKATGLLKGKDIIIVPDGFLNYLPFELLIEDHAIRDFKDYNYLIKRHSISYYPSATVLHFERTNKQTPHAPTQDFLGIAVSDFQNNHCYEENIAPFLPLPLNESEVDNIAKRFANNRVLKGKQTKESDLKGMNLTPYRYLHFSTHGLINTENPDFSRILLTPADTEDGCLNLYEIFDLELNADLVSLSACETGLGKLVRGEGMVGFTRALMYAGTPSVILSLWNVADESTKNLFVNYYSELSQNGADKYLPLRAAQLHMIQQGGEYANPFYWAPFIFIGERNSRY